MKKIEKISMTTLKKTDTIKIGIYAGMKLNSCLIRYGKKAICEILKYYNLSEEIMQEYHCHLEPHITRSKKKSAQILSGKSINAGKVHEMKPWAKSYASVARRHDVLKSSDAIYVNESCLARPHPKRETRVRSSRNCTQHSMKNLSI